MTIRNKRDVITMCHERITWIDGITDPVKRHYALSSAYYDCKATAAAAGYVDGCFDALWHRAVDQHAREIGVFAKVV